MNHETSNIKFKPDSSHCPAQMAICAECKQQDTVRHGVSDGISTQVFIAPDGGFIGRYLHRGACERDWYTRYVTWMRTHHPERAVQWQDRETQDRNRRERSAA